MIDSLPLDMFGDDEPEDAPATDAPATEAPATDAATTDAPATTNCPWCEAEIAGDATTCPACGARIRPDVPAPPTPLDSICQWCGATIAPEIDTCPACGWDARGENQVEMPGITTPLSETQIRSLYGGDAEAEPDPADAIALVAELIGLILPND